jgi:hypothetical protein
MGGAGNGAAPPSQTVSATTAADAVTVADTSRLDVVASVSQTNVHLLAVGQPVADEQQVAPIGWIGGNRVVAVRVQSVVHQLHLASAQSLVALGHSGASPIGEDGVISRHQPTKIPFGITEGLIKGKGGIHIPVCHAIAIAPHRQDRGVQVIVISTYSAALDDEIRTPGPLQLLIQIISIATHHDFGVVGVLQQIPVALAVVDVLFHEDNLMPQSVQSTADAAVVGSCSIPVG